MPSLSRFQPLDRPSSLKTFKAQSSVGSIVKVRRYWYFIIFFIIIASINYSCPISMIIKQSLSFQSLRRIFNFSTKNKPSKPKVQTVGFASEHIENVKYIDFYQNSKLQNIWAFRVHRWKVFDLSKQSFDISYVKRLLDAYHWNDIFLLCSPKSN